LANAVFFLLYSGNILRLLTGILGAETSILSFLPLPCRLTLSLHGVKD
jgi:hypothetical protein